MVPSKYEHLNYDEIYFEDPREAEVGTKPMLGSPKKVPRNLDFFISSTVIEKTRLILNGR